MSREDVAQNTLPRVQHPSPARYPRRNADLRLLADLEDDVRGCAW